MGGERSGREESCEVALQPPGKGNALEQTIEHYPNSRGRMQQLNIMHSMRTAANGFSINYNRVSTSIKCEIFP